MSAVLALANPHRIKASHRRRRRVASGRFVQRYYDPMLGRFLSPDPDPSDMNTGWNFNRYNYAANNPYKFTDPDGRQVVIVQQREAPPVTAIPGEGPYSGTTTKPSLGEVVVNAIVKASEKIDISFKAVTLVAKYYLNEAIDQETQPVPGAVDLEDDLAGQEVIGDIEAGGGKVLEGMGDKKFDPVTGTHDKVARSRTNADGTKTEVHAERNRETNKVDSAKIKQDHPRSRDNK